METESGWGARGWGRGGESGMMGAQVQFEEMVKAWKWMCGCTLYMHLIPLNFKMFQMASFRLYTFYCNKKK